MPVAEVTQQRLLEAAGQEFAEKGFEGATVRSICDRAGVNVAAVKYHFGDKEQLYKATLKNAFRCRLDHLPTPKWPAGTPPATKLRDFIRVMVNNMIQDQALPWQMQLLMRALAVEPSAAGVEMVREFIRPIYELLWSILREVLPAGVSEETLHLTAFSIIGQGFYLRAGRPVLCRV